jgi:hypothetical protein
MVELESGRTLKNIWPGSGGTNMSVYQSLYVTFLIRNIIYRYLTFFMRNKIYTEQSLFPTKFYVTKFIRVKVHNNRKDLNNKPIHGVK